MLKCLTATYYEEKTTESNANDWRGDVLFKFDHLCIHILFSWLAPALYIADIQNHWNVIVTFSAMNFESPVGNITWYNNPSHV